MKLFMDFESRSAADIWAVGAWNYSCHPSTEILCLAYALDNGPVQVITNFDLGSLPKADLYSSFNAFFEQSMYRNILVKRYGWPEIPIKQWRCSAAKAAARSLPRSLEQCAKVLGTKHQKDMSGKRTMLKLAKSEGPIDERELQQLYQYCIEDVLTERDIDAALPDLTEKEQVIWFHDQLINQRGVAVDKEAIDAAIQLVEEHTTKLNAQIVTITNGELDGVSRRKAVMDWIKKQGVEIEGYTKKDVQDLLATPLPDKVRTVLETRVQLGKTSVKKYEAMQNAVDTDGRVRDLLLYHGAGTGRWCLPGEAEVLSPKGWIRMDRYANETILQVKSGEGQWTQPVMNHFDYDGNMVGIEHSFLRGIFTPEHKFPVVDKRGNEKIRFARELSSGDKIPLSCTFSTMFVPKEQTRVWVMVQADGHICEDRSQGRCIRFHFKKERKINRCRTLLAVAGVSFSERVYEGVTEIKVTWANAPKWMRKKRFDSSVLQHNAACFIHEISFWDSHVQEDGGVEYCNTNYADCEWVATMAHLAGKAATITKRNRQTEGWADSYRVFIRPASRVSLRKNHLSTVKYTGKVYCPTTESGYFLCRYNNLIFVSGNSGKLVQIQNLPSAKGEKYDNENLVATIKRGALADFTLLYGDVMKWISLAIRGMFVAPDGKKLIVADYNAIEARVLFWLAEEEKGLKAYREGRDIYVDTAEVIYGRTNISKPERQLGKISVLGCIAKDSMVYSDNGFIPIQTLNRGQRLWDGEQWVNFRELVPTGKKSVIQIGDVWLTPDHRLLTKDGWRIAGEIVSNAGIQARLLDKFLGDGRLQEENITSVLNVVSLSVANAELRKVQELTRFSEALKDHVVNVINRSQVNEAEDPVNMLISSLINVYGRSGVRAGTILNDVVKTRITPTLEGMVLEGFKSASNPVEISWNTLLLWMGGGLGDSLSIELIMPKGTHREILELLHRERTIGTKVEDCYDILGTDNERFQVGTFLAHNSGYGMGAPKFLVTCQSYGVNIDERLAEKAVRSYRTIFNAVPRFWYALESGAIRTISTREDTRVGKVVWHMDGGVLLCRLPSGRDIAYNDAELKDGKITFKSVNSDTHQWEEDTTYGGKLTENICQGVARDILAEAMLRAERAGFPIVMHVHDEAVAEVTPDKTVKEFEKLLEVVPDWATGLPLKVEGFECTRYQK